MLWITVPVAAMSRTIPASQSTFVSVQPAPRAPGRTRWLGLACFRRGRLMGQRHGLRRNRRCSNVLRPSPPHPRRAGFPPRPPRSPRPACSGPAPARHPSTRGSTGTESAEASSGEVDLARGWTGRIAPRASAPAPGPRCQGRQAPRRWMMREKPSGCSCPGRHPYRRRRPQGAERARLARSSGSALPGSNAASSSLRLTTAAHSPRLAWSRTWCADSCPTRSRRCCSSCR